MWWLATTDYHLGGLVWLIAVAVIFLIALAALIAAGRAMARARGAMRMVHDRGALNTTTTRPLSPTASATFSPGGTASVQPLGPGPAGAEELSLGDSLKILHERYARGDISREEYLQRREDMLGRPAA